MVRGKSRVPASGEIRWRDSWVVPRSTPLTTSSHQSQTKRDKCKGPSQMFVNLGGEEEEEEEVERREGFEARKDFMVRIGCVNL